MNPDVSACSQGGVDLYSSCFSLFKTLVASFYSVFPGRLQLYLPLFLLLCSFSVSDFWQMKITFFNKYGMS